MKGVIQTKMEEESLGEESLVELEEVYGEAGRAAGEMEVGDSEDNEGREGRKWKGRNGET